MKPRNIFTDFIYLFLDRAGRDWEREGEKHQCVIASLTSPTRDLAQNLGMCPDWEMNWWPFGVQARTQSTEPHQSGQKILSQMYSKKSLLWATLPANFNKWMQQNPYDSPSHVSACGTDTCMSTHMQALPHGGTHVSTLTGMHTCVDTQKSVLTVLILQIFAITPPPHEASTEHTAPLSSPSLKFRGVFRLCYIV